MELLYLLESIRTPVLDKFMLLITQMGEETAFLVVALIVFWCVDKRRGYYLLAVGFTGTVLNQIMKLSFRVPRPWVIDSDFNVVEQAKAAAGGYSFPSGHSQSAVGTFGALGRVVEDKRFRWLFIAIAVLVPFSRMYLGVHTLKDVAVGSLMAAILVIALQPLVYSEEPGRMKLLLSGMLVLATGFLLYVELWKFPEDLDAHNYQSGLKNVYAILGALIGVAVTYVVDEKYLHFPVKASRKIQLVKAVMGLLLVLTAKEGLRTPLEMLLPVYPARAVRYFLIVVVAGVLWPMSFRKLSAIRKAKGEV